MKQVKMLKTATIGNNAFLKGKVFNDNQMPKDVMDALIADKSAVPVKAGEAVENQSSAPAPKPKKEVKKTAEKKKKKDK